MQLAALDLNLVVALDALLDTGSVSRAARRVGVSTSAMSHTLARLRAQLGDPLFVRAGRGLSPTPRAEELRGPVRIAMHALHDVFQPPEAVEPATLRRSFRLQMTDHVALLLGPPLDRLVSAEAPGVDLLFLPVEAEIASPLRSGELDLAIGVWSALPGGVRRETLYEEGFVCVVRADHPTVGAELELSRYAALPHVLVSPRGRPGGYVDQVLERLGLKRRGARVVPYFVPAVQLVATSDMVLTVSERVAHAFAEVWPIRVLRPPLPLQRYALEMAWHEGTGHDPESRWLRRAVRAATAQLPALEGPQR